MDESIIRWAEIEPACLLRLLAKKFWLILLAAAICFMGASIVLDTLISRTYTSTATLVVTPRAGTSVYYTNTSTAADVAEIYTELLESNIMSKTVSDVLDGLKRCAEDYRDRLEAL